MLSRGAAHVSLRDILDEYHRVCAEGERRDAEHDREVGRLRTELAKWASFGRDGGYAQADVDAAWKAKGYGG